MLDKLWIKDCNLVITPMEKNLKLTSTEGSTFEDPRKYMQLVVSLNSLTTSRRSMECGKMSAQLFERNLNI